MPQFQYASDLHLEFYDKHDKGAIDFRQWIEPSAPYLILAGDIGQPHRASYHTFIRQAATAFDRIYLIAGNHEFYNKTMPMDAIKQNIRTGLPANVEFLDNTATTTPEGLRILGSTLWSNILPHEMVDSLYFLADFRLIKHTEDKAWTPHSYILQHATDRNWLEEQLNDHPEQPTLVMTHHLPSFECIADEFVGKPMNSCFASDLDELFVPPVKAWVAGHTHTPMIKEVNEIPVYINPAGYPNEHRKYNRKATFNVEL